MLVIASAYALIDFAQPFAAMMPVTLGSFTFLSISVGIVIVGFGLFLAVYLYVIFFFVPFI